MNTQIFLLLFICLVSIVNKDNAFLIFKKSIIKLQRLYADLNHMNDNLLRVWRDYCLSLFNHVSCNKFPSLNYESKILT